VPDTPDEMCTDTIDENLRARSRYTDSKSAGLGCDVVGNDALDWSRA